VSGPDRLNLRQARRALSRPRRLTVLGSTGSIGRSTLDLITRDAASYSVEALTAFSNVTLLAEQARQTGARRAVIGDPAAYGALKAALAGSGIEAMAGAQAVIEALAAVRRGAVVALANKEALVCAGDLMMKAVQRHGATLLPVDSEHNAIFQVFDFERPETVERLILTASGGPFRDADPAVMAAATPAQAVAHPNWSMGAKISVDSATMMNKGLELIEASHLFPIPPDQIEILVHPQSVVHSLVAYVDGSVLAQLGPPDMRTPIAYTLAWPGRIATPSARLDLAKLASLTFQAPEPERFPALRLARAALAAFLAGRIGFLDIAAVVEVTLAAVNGGVVDSLDAVRQADASARRLAEAHIADRARRRA
jgi:1-deoxy-D-xylulose-5-phosphate reductoisomerase